MIKKVPPPPSGTGDTPPWVDDEKAKQEEENWPNEKALLGQKKKNKLLIIGHSGWLAVIFMWFFSFVFIASLSVWLIHNLTTCNWLSADQLSRIQSVIFSGSIGAIVASFAQKHLSDPN